jgi:hypothetical protein
MLALDADPVAIWSLVVAVIAAVAAIIAAAAAIWTLVYAKEAPTKDDLARVEQNTAHLEEVRSKIASMDKRQRSQQELESLYGKARRLSILVSGQDDIPQPLRVNLTIKDSTALLSRVELFNEVGSVFGSVDCVRNPDAELAFRAVIEFQTVSRWKAAGTMVQAYNRVRLNLRVYMFFEGHEVEVFRDMAVHVTDESRRLEGAIQQTVSAIRIEGSV